MDIGSLATNPNKVKLIETIAKKGQKIEEIAKRTRIPAQTVQNLLSELVDEGFVSKDGEIYRISEKGLKAIKEIREDAGGKRK
ncbi:MAG: winged helix-turn-helix domain-containing protein [Archaeoglobaceae archaeon]